MNLSQAFLQSTVMNEKPSVIGKKETIQGSSIPIKKKESWDFMP